MALSLLGVLIAITFFYKPKSPKEKEILETRKIKENDEVYNHTLKYLKTCNYGERNPNFIKNNYFIYKDNYNRESLLEDFMFYCALSFIKKEDLGIHDEFSRRQVDVFMPPAYINKSIKDIFGRDIYPRRSYKEIYLDRLNTYVDINYDEKKDLYHFISINEEINKYKPKYEEVYYKYLGGEYKKNNNESVITYKEKFIVVEERGKELLLYPSFKKDKLIAKIDSNSFKKEDYLDKGSEITYIYKIYNGRWTYFSSIN